MNKEMERNTCQDTHICANLIMQIVLEGFKRLAIKVQTFLHKSNLVSTDYQNKFLNIAEMQES